MNVALVDDCQKDLDYLSTLLLQKLGNHISLHIFHSGKEFLSFWKPGSYDLVILDILMPPCWKFWTASRTEPTGITIWKFPLT